MANPLDEDFFKSVIESSRDCIRILDPQGRVLFMNKGGLAAFEIDDDAPLIGASCVSLWPEPAASEIAKGLNAVQRGESYRFEGRCPTARGKARWWDVSLAPIRAGDGKLVGIIASSRDITETMGERIKVERRELKLERAAASLRSAFEIARVGAWEVDFVTRKTLFSAELCQLLGSPPLAPMSIAESVEFWLEDDRAQFQAALDRAEMHGERLTFEGRSRAPDRSITWRRVFGEPVMVDGRCVALRGVTQDITDWMSVLEREKSAVRAVDATSAFLETMSHELRTPLNGVLGMAQAMLRDELSAPQREKLGLIRTSGQALLSLLNDLLDVSKIKAGRLVLEDGVVDTEQLAAGVRSIFSELLRDKDVRLEVTVEAEAGGIWGGDPNRIRQVLHNLVSNAVKFTAKGVISVCISYAKERLTLRVQDTGIGIPKARLADVRDRFVQADVSTTRPYGGSGLGLAISHDLVALMAGELRLDSIEGVGTTCIVDLPLARAVAPEAEVAEQSGATPHLPRGLRVLAAEDNLTNQLVLKALLGAVGIDPVIVANGQEALDAWRTEAWDVVLMDVQMPVMDGITATKLLRAAEARAGCRRTPVIALTANAMPHQRAEYLAAGMDDLVAKPVTIGLLLQGMDAAIGEHRGPDVGWLASVAAMDGV